MVDIECVIFTDFLLLIFKRIVIAKEWGLIYTTLRNRSLLELYIRRNRAFNLIFLAGSQVHVVEQRTRLRLRGLRYDPGLSFKYSVDV